MPQARQALCQVTGQHLCAVHHRALLKRGASLMPKKRAKRKGHRRCGTCMSHGSCVWARVTWCVRTVVVLALAAAYTPCSVGDQSTKYSLKKRPYLGPTSMDAALSFVMCNMAKVRLQMSPVLRCLPLTHGSMTAVAGWS